jgi:hypothetical protein
MSPFFTASWRWLKVHGRHMLDGVTSKLIDFLVFFFKQGQLCG